MLAAAIPSDVLSTGIPACLMTLCENISYGVLDNLMALSGTAAQAGIGVAKKVNMLAHCMVRGMAQGVLPDSLQLRGRRLQAYALRGAHLHCHIRMPGRALHRNQPLLCP
ncbi:MAG: hypothetical protein ACLU5K_01680 [Christensenellales bacterium]